MFQFPFLCKNHESNKELQNLFIDAHFKNVFPEKFQFEEQDYFKFVGDFLEDDQVTGFLILDDIEDDHLLEDKVKFVLMKDEKLKNHLLNVAKRAEIKHKNMPSCHYFSVDNLVSSSLNEIKLLELLVNLKQIVNEQFFFHLISKYNIPTMCHGSGSNCFERLIDLMKENPELEIFENFKSVTKLQFQFNDFGDSIWYDDSFNHSRYNDGNISYFFPQFFLTEDSTYEWMDYLTINQVEEDCFKYLRDVKNNLWFVRIEDHDQVINRTPFKKLKSQKGNEDVIQSALDYLGINKKPGDLNMNLAKKLLFNILPYEIHRNLCGILGI